jgi:hypothetical protein
MALKRSTTAADGAALKSRSLKTTEMKERILTNWNWVRVMYLALGVFMTVQALASQQWFVALAGTYFASMGLFGFGCASGSCAVDNRHASEGGEPVSDVKFEEVKPPKHD